MDDAKRKGLIEAAMEEFAERGIDGASYNKIIERSGLSKGTVYYYFDNKESLLCTVMQSLCEDFMRAVGPFEFPDTKEDYWGCVWRYNKRVVDAFVENPLQGRVLMMLSAEGGPLGERMMSIHDRALKGVDELLRRGQELGAVRRDLSFGTIRHLLYAVRKVLGFSFFEGWDLRAQGLNRDKISEFVWMMHDFSKRMLTPEEEENV